MERESSLMLGVGILSLPASLSLFLSLCLSPSLSLWTCPSGPPRSPSPTMFPASDERKSLLLL